MRLICTYLNVDDLPSSSTQKIMDVVVLLDQFREELLSNAHKNPEDETAIHESFHIGHQKFQAAVARIALFAEAIKPKIHPDEQQKLQDTIDQLKALRWDIPYSYIMAIQSGLNPNLKGIQRAVIEFPNLPHAVLIMGAQEDDAIVLDETPFGFGSNISLLEYTRNVEKEMGDIKLAKYEMMQSETVSNLINRYFPK
jgi:hypothetical protein